MVSGFSGDIEEQRKEIADKEAQIARLREEIAMAQLSIEHMERERAQADEALDKTVAEAGRRSGQAIPRKKPSHYSVGIRYVHQWMLVDLDRGA